jgi:hypothetical protein
MKPPEKTNVLDKHNGFTAITTKNNDTLWRPGNILTHRIGTLVSFDEHSFYQNNNDCTKAIYKVRGYRFPIVCWFDNTTGERIA